MKLNKINYVMFLVSFAFCFNTIFSQETVIKKISIGAGIKDNSQKYFDQPIGKQNITLPVYDIRYKIYETDNSNLVDYTDYGITLGIYNEDPEQFMFQFNSINSTGYKINDWMIFPYATAGTKMQNNDFADPSLPETELKYQGRMYDYGMMVQYKNIDLKLSYSQTYFQERGDFFKRITGRLLDRGVNYSVGYLIDKIFDKNDMYPVLRLLISGGVQFAIMKFRENNINFPFDGDVLSQENSFNIGINYGIEL
ncbi:MAG: hypothetical protein ACEPO8_03130 [Rhodothermaceae bacterium]